MISIVRDYIKARIAEEDPKLKEWEDAFNIDNIPASQLSDYYHIVYAVPNNLKIENCLAYETVTAKLTLYRAGFQKPQVALDAIMNKAHNIKLRAANPTVLTGTGSMKYVEVTGPNPDPVLTNDNTVKCELDFNFLMIFNVL